MKTAEDTTLNRDEMNILVVLETLHPGLKIQTVERRGARHFDLSLTGHRTFRYLTQDCTYSFSAWLPLMAIQDLLNGDDLKQAYAMSDIPEMAGDWSAIRDSDEETIWRIFRTLVLKTEGGAK